MYGTRIYSLRGEARQACILPAQLPVQVGGAWGLPAQGIEVLLGTCTRQLLIEFLIDKLQVSAVLPRLPQRPLDLLHPLTELPVALLQSGHLLLQLLDVILFLKQGLLH